MKFLTDVGVPSFLYKAINHPAEIAAWSPTNGIKNFMLMEQIILELLKHNSGN